MAEWAVLITVFVVTAAAYAFNRRVYEAQSLVVWCVAGLIITAGLIVYVFTKVGTATHSWSDHYQIEGEP